MTSKWPVDPTKYGELRMMKDISAGSLFWFATTGDFVLTLKLTQIPGSSEYWPVVHLPQGAAPLFAEYDHLPTRRFLDIGPAVWRMGVKPAALEPTGMAVPGRFYLGPNRAAYFCVSGAKKRDDVLIALSTLKTEFPPGPFCGFATWAVGVEDAKKEFIELVSSA